MAKKKIRIGVFGGFRGKTMVEWCVLQGGAEVVAICDKNEDVLKNCREFLDAHNYKITKLYRSFDEFLEHDMDAVVVANYATEHAPFAIRCLEKGLHVLSEVLPVQTLDEAVRLAEAVEKSGKIYAYAENYCYMPGPMEMRRLYKEGVFGELEYGEGEYCHNMEDCWLYYTYGESDHWRNRLHSFFYCTHSVGPILHATGLRPVSVVGMETPPRKAMLDQGRRSGGLGLEVVTMENGAIVRSLHGSLKRNSVWYSLCGTKAHAETGRDGIVDFCAGQMYLFEESEGSNGVCNKYSFYNPKPGSETPYGGEFGVIGEKDCKKLKWDGRRDEKDLFGHMGSDYYTMDNFVRKIRGEEADTIDVYEALDMFFVGHFAYFSALDGGKPQQIPDFRDKAVREKYRGDVRCTDPKVAGDQVLPTYSKGTPEVAPEVYQSLREKYLASVK